MSHELWAMTYGIEEGYRRGCEAQGMMRRVLTSSFGHVAIAVLVVGGGMIGAGVTGLSKISKYSPNIRAGP